jgi:hypothetical protein
MMAEAPKTHFQLAYSAMKPERMFPNTLPRGAPAAGGKVVRERDVSRDFKMDEAFSLNSP